MYTPPFSLRLPNSYLLHYKYYFLSPLSLPLSPSFSLLLSLPIPSLPISLLSISLPPYLPPYPPPSPSLPPSHPISLSLSLSFPPLSPSLSPSGILGVTCRMLLDHLHKLPGDGRTMVGFLTVDSSLHFYNLKVLIIKHHTTCTINLYFLLAG